MFQTTSFLLFLLSDVLLVLSASLSFFSLSVLPLCLCSCALCSASLCLCSSASLCLCSCSLCSASLCLCLSASDSSRESVYITLVAPSVVSKSCLGGFRICELHSFYVSFVIPQFWLYFLPDPFELAIRSSVFEEISSILSCSSPPRQPLHQKQRSTSDNSISKLRPLCLLSLLLCA